MILSGLSLYSGYIPLGKMWANWNDWRSSLW
nr:MAG TPA: hypothetical protein [Caudoviricetes sp.]